MKTVLFWKSFDLAGQLLMLTPLLLLAAPEGRGYAICVYFSVGAWQALSAAAATPTSNSTRR